MKQATVFPLCLFLLAMVAFDGCSRQSRLADRIIGANHVLVLKRTGPHEAVSMSIEGEEVSAVVRAASSATAKAREAGPPPAFDANIKIAFLKGSNVLAVVIANEGRFAIDDQEYVDGTGTLRALGSAPIEKWRPTSYEQYQRPR